jgi:hypothetical protein
VRPIASWSSGQVPATGGGHGGHAAENFAVLRRLALHLPEREQTAKRLKAGATVICSKFWLVEHAIALAHAHGCGAMEYNVQYNDDALT